MKRQGVEYGVGREKVEVWLGKCKEGGLALGAPDTKTDASQQSWEVATGTR